MTPQTTTMPAAGAGMRPREFLSELLAVEPVMGDSAILTFAAPDGFATSVGAGQFVDCLCRPEGIYDPLIRRPYSICSVDRAANTFTILVRPYGRGSAWLIRQPVGTLIDILGPLGNRFQVAEKTSRLLLVAGGVGAAPLVLLAEEAVRRGQSVTYLMGAQNAEALLPPHVLPEEVEYVVATDDGSAGTQGFVTDLTRDYLRWADQIFACGPEPMFKALRQVVLANRIGNAPSVQVSMERTMPCGLGACLGCVVETKHGMLASCVQGPVYDMDEVIWT